MMPTQSWKNLDPETGVHGKVDEKDWPLIRENWPAYDKKLTRTNTMGAVAEMFRQWPGSVRSDHPARSICAWGKLAAGKALCAQWQGAFAGTGYNKNTSMHLADVRAEYAGKHMCIEHSAIWENGKRVWKAYETLFVDGEDFEQIGADFEKEHAVRMTQIGNAVVRLMRQRELVNYAVTWMEKNRV